MQIDMHYYGTYAIARAAGIPPNDAHVIAYSAQFVDDSTEKDSFTHEDGGLLYGISTAHHNIKAGASQFVESEVQRRVWVPFHFLPGGDGDSFFEKLLCVRDSKIAQEMIKNHICQATAEKSFGMELIGIACHVYMDTFSHYGFSGISTEFNKIKNDSIELIDIKDEKMRHYVEGKAKNFFAKFGSEVFGSSFLESISGALGHGAVATYPDRPYLHWTVAFEKDRPANDNGSNRDNPATFLEGCKKLHGHLSEFTKLKFSESDIVPFENLSEVVDEILRFEGKKQQRIDKWLDAIERNLLFTREKSEPLPNYDAEDWEREKEELHKFTSSDKVIELNIYKFHQAACYHRYYVLKDLLPAHGIAVY